MTSDRSQQKSDLPGTEPVPNGHAMPEVAAPDLAWLPSDHDAVEGEDETAPDPWRTDIADKEASAENADDALDALKGGQIMGAGDADSSSETVLPKTRGQRNLFKNDDIGVQTTLLGKAIGIPPAEDSESGPPTKAISPNDIPDQDWPDEENLDNEVDDGLEAFDLDESPDEESEDDFDIVEFDEDAQQTLWEPQEEERTLRRARGKAAAIVKLLVVSNASERDDALEYLTKLFWKRRHKKTFLAIQKRAEGADFSVLKRIVDWLSSTRIGYTPKRDSTLTRDVAHLAYLKRNDYPPEHMIPSEWFDEWLQLPHDNPSHHSFSVCVEEKLLHQEAELLDQGLRLWAYDEEYAEPSDRFTCDHRVPDHDMMNNYAL